MDTPSRLPEWPAAPARSRLRGRLWRLVAVLFLILAFFWPAALAIAGVIRPEEMQQMPFELGLLVFGLIGVKFYLRGKRHMAIAATELLARDTRPPVIYLRSFQHDAAGAGSPSGSRFWGSYSALLDLKTVEERLAEAFAGIGPVVAIGKPGEKLPALGAARLYVGDDAWQETVHALMAKARLVVLLLGDTPGFWWELERSVEKLPPEKLVLIVPFRKKRYEAFRRRAAEHFPHPLPEFGSRIGWTAFRFRPKRGLGKLVGLIYFRKNWSAEYVDLTRIKTPWRLTPHYIGRQRLERSLNWNLRTVFEQLGMPWKPPKARKFITGMAAVLLAFMIVSLTGTAITAIPAWLEIRRSDAARAAAYDGFIRRIQGSPEIGETYGSRLTVNSADAVGHDLAQKGLLRLDDQAVIERQRIIGENWHGNSRACIAPLINRADPMPAEALRYERAATVETWYRILGDAAIAEARKASEEIVPSDDEAKAAFDEYARRNATNGFTNVLFIVRENTKAPNLKRFLETLQFGDPYTIYVEVLESEICRVFGDLYKGAAVLPPPHNANLARALAGALR